MGERFAAIAGVALLTGCAANNEQVEGIVVTFDTQASMITEVPAVYVPEGARPVEGASIRTGEPPMTAIFDSREDGRFDFTMLGDGMPSQGAGRTLAASAPGYESVEYRYGARPGQGAKYFMVVLEKSH